MLTRSLTSLAACAACLVTLTAGAVASAGTPAPATGPGTAACEEATASVTLAATAAAKAAGELADAQGRLGDANKAVQDKLAALVAANNALKGASDDLTADELAALKAAAEKAGAAFAGSVKGLLDLGSGGTADLVAALDAARLKLTAAVDVRVTACAAPATPADPKKCTDFPTRADAQAYLERDPSDPLGLDPDHDGFACHTAAVSTPHTQVTAVPSGSVATGG